MKFIFTLSFIFVFSVSFSQWTRVEQLPASDIFSLYRNDSVLYAGGYGKVYITNDNGQSWDSVSLAPVVTSIDAIILYKNELFVSSYGVNVFKSRDGGRTWQNVGTGIFPFVSEFCEWKGNLYAATLGGGVFKLDSVVKNRWISFNNGLSSLSANLNTIAANTHTMIAGTLANGIFDKYSDDATSWTEGLVINRIDPSGIIYNVITAHDSLFMAGRTSFFLSTDNGTSWNKIGSQLNSTNNNMVNASQALIVARNMFNGATNNTSFYYLNKNSLQTQFIGFSSLIDHYNYRIEILGDKLWDASSHGLFYMPLSTLPGITPVDNEDTVETVLPGVDPVPTTTYSFSVGSVYPNPLASTGYVPLSLDKSGYISAHLYDVDGKLVSILADHRQLNAGNSIFSFSMEKLGSGVYFLRLLINNQVFVRKIVHTL